MKSEIHRGKKNLQLGYFQLNNRCTLFIHHKNSLYYILNLLTITFAVVRSDTQLHVVNSVKFTKYCQMS